MGPVQVVVVGLDRPHFSGEVLAEFTRLGEAGIVRLLDILLVSRAEDGTLETVPSTAEAGTDLGRLAAEFLGRSEGAVDEDAASADSDQVQTWSLAAAVPVGGTAAVALIEHSWAAPLSAAIQRAGGQPLEETWLARADLDVLEALMAKDA